MTSHINLSTIFFETFHLAPRSTYHLIFLNQHISLTDQCLKFLIFYFDEIAFGFLGIIQCYFWSLSLFPSQILVCATDFCSSISLFIWRFTFDELFQQKNRRVERYCERLRLQPVLQDVGPNSREWVESCYYLSKWRFDQLYFPPQIRGFTMESLLI